MDFRIPFTFQRFETLRSRPNFFSKLIKPQKKSTFRENLYSCNVNISREEYIGICIKNLFFSFIIITVIILSLLAIFKLSQYFALGFLASIAVSSFIFITQMNYPRLFVNRRKKNIEKNLIPALEDILIQLDSGMPLFDVMVNISAADYDELSIEFKKAVKEISSGVSEQTVLENLSKNNPSFFFKRTLWQISNGMNAGSDVSVIIKQSVKELNEEQMIQIQNYGNSLNPLIVFYMLIAIIIPALSITFLTVIASITGLSENTSNILFIGLLVTVCLIQVMFLGLIKSKRPSLL